MTDGVSDEWINRARTLDPGTRWHILPLGMTVARYISSSADQTRNLADVSVVDVSPYAEEAQQKVKTFYLPLMFKLPRTPLRDGRTLLSELATRLGNLWWFLEISEKSPLRGNVFNSLYFVTLTQAVLKSESFQSVWVSVADRTLSKTLSTLQTGCQVLNPCFPPKTSWHQAIGAFLRRRFRLWLLISTVRYVWRALKLYAAVRWTGIDRCVSGGRDLMVFTRYPALWRRPFSVDAEDTMYADLQGELNKYASVCYGAWLHLSPGEVFRHRSVIFQLFSTRNIVILNSLCHLRDLLSLLSPRRLFCLFRVERNLIPYIRVTFEGADVAHLIQEEIRRSLWSTELLNDELLVRAISRVVERFGIKGIVHSSEFQPIEKAIWYGARGKTRVVAFQHSTIGKNKLQYHFAPGEIETALRLRNPAEDMPLPDFFLASGRYPFEVMRENGFPEDRMAICGAVRYQKLWAWTQKMPDPQALRKLHGISTNDRIFFVTLSLESAEVSIDLVQCILQSLPENAQNILVLVKSHPLLSLDTQVSEMARSIGPAVRFQVLAPDISLLDMMIMADAIFLTSSSTALEAAVLGRTVVIYENTALFPLAPVADVSRIGLIVRDGEEMRRAVTLVLRNDPSLDSLREAARQEVKNIFSHLDGTADEHFARFLKQRGIIRDPSRDPVV